MQLELINGQFSTLEVLDLVSQMVATKIRFLENKVCNSSQEEDIKSKEAKIIALQNKLTYIRQKLNTTSRDIKLHCTIELDIYYESKL